MASVWSGTSPTITCFARSIGSWTFRRSGRHLEPYYSETGRPSIDPELMMRMLIVGYSFGIRSERRLCDEVHLNLAYRWFCRLGLDGEVPGGTTTSPRTATAVFARAVFCASSSRP